MPDRHPGGRPPIRGESASRTLSQRVTDGEARVLRLAAEHIPCSLSRYVLEAALARAVVDLRGVGLDREAERAEGLLEASVGSVGEYPD